MEAVGIIANPASGKDIRRLVAYGSVFDNHEKVNIVKRLLRAMNSIGVREVFFMPDYFGIGQRALEDIDVSLQVSFLDMAVTGTQIDSMQAAAMMSEMGIALIVTLGGDGTNRVVAKSCGATPLLPISTGTNNVFPFMVEGTLAGLAAGIAAMNSISLENMCQRTARLEICRASKQVDIALVDVVVSTSSFTATKAIWEIETLKEIFLTRSVPGNIGFSSVGGLLCQLTPNSDKGLHVIIGPGEKKVMAPIAPGLVHWLPIQSHRIVEFDKEIPLSPGPSVIALDGEREITVNEGEAWSLRFSDRGPLVLDMDRVWQEVSAKSMFVADQFEKEVASGVEMPRKN